MFVLNSHRIQLVSVQITFCRSRRPASAQFSRISNRHRRMLPPITKQSPSKLWGCSATGQYSSPIWQQIGIRSRQAKHSSSSWTRRLPPPRLSVRLLPPPTIRRWIHIRGGDRDGAPTEVDMAPQLPIPLPPIFSGLLFFLLFFMRIHAISFHFARDSRENLDTLLPAKSLRARTTASGHSTGQEY